MVFSRKRTIQEITVYGKTHLREETQKNILKKKTILQSWNNKV